MIFKAPVFAAMFLALAFMPAPSNAQNFSCSYGQPACLDYGAIVCKSTAKCVPRDAVVFDSYTCNFKGFVCKSQMDGVVDEYESLRQKYNDLVSDANELRDSLQKAIGSIDELKRVAASTEDELTNLKNCISLATTIETAKACY